MYCTSGNFCFELNLDILFMLTSAFVTFSYWKLVGTEFFTMKITVECKGI